MRITSLRTRNNGPRLPWLMAGLPLTLVAVWLVLGNLGCITWDTFWAFAIKFDPPYFLLQSGKTGNVEAELIWSNTKPLEAKTWAVHSLPKALTSATCSPTVDSESTTVTLNCGTDPSIFGGTELWTASTSSSYQLGVRATFVDPVWKSVSEGQEAVISRTAYLPLRGGASTIVVKPISRGYAYTQYEIRVLNPMEGWRYSYSGYDKYMHETDSSLQGSGNFGTQELGSGLASYERANYIQMPGVKVLVVFLLKQVDNNGKLAKTEEKSFRFHF